MDKITTFLWFDGQAEEAATFYTGLFPDSRIDETTRSTVDYPGGKDGDVITVAFTLSGRAFIAMNGGPGHPFTDAISLSIDCADQAEVDRCWEALSEGGEPIQCGWIKDRFGLHWQVTPRILPRLLIDPDRAKAGRVMEAMMQMTKLDVARSRPRRRTATDGGSSRRRTLIAPVDSLATVETVTLFVDDLAESSGFYKDVFRHDVLHEDDVSCLIGLGNLMLNLLLASEAATLIEPAAVADRHAGCRTLLTIRVDDVDDVCEALERRDVAVLNGPIDRPWGRRTAAFADPSGHAWEIAQELKN